MDSLVNAAEHPAATDDEKEEAEKTAKSDKIKTPEIPLRSDEKPLKDVYGWTRETDVVSSGPGAILSALHAIELTPVEKSRTNEARCDGGDSAFVHWTAAIAGDHEPTVVEDTYQTEGKKHPKEVKIGSR